MTGLHRDLSDVEGLPVAERFRRHVEDSGGIIYEAMRSRTVALGGKEGILEREVPASFHIAKKVLQKWGKPNSRRHVVSLGAAIAANTITRTYGNRGKFGTFVAADPALEGHTGKLQFEQYRDSVFNNTKSAVRILNHRELYKLFDVRDEEQVDHRNHSVGKDFVSQALGDSVPVGMLEPFMEALVSACGGQSDLHVRSREHRLFQQGKFSSPMALKRKKTRGGVKYWTWV